MKEKTSSALQPGTRLESPKDTYIVDKVLGAGGFGITYRVRRLSDNRLLALKEYFPDKLCERSVQSHDISFLQSNSKTIEAGIEDFITEAKRLDKHSISHPNIVAVSEVFNANNTAYYSMEYIAGKDLNKLIGENLGRPLSTEQALSIIGPILNAVNLLHSKRITHLDIKPDNIILTRLDDGAIRPVLIDFGLSKHYDRKGRATSTLSNAGCSDGYSPPEQYGGLDKFTPQADVYALCAMLLFLLTGRRPVKYSDITPDIIRTALDERAVPEYIREAIVGGMDSAIDFRTPSVIRLAEKLQLDITTQGYEQSVTYILQLDKKKKDKHIRVKPLIIGVAACALIAPCMIWWFNRNPDQVASEHIAAIDTGANSVTSSADTVAPIGLSLEKPETRTAESDDKDTADETNDEKFARATRNNDFSLLLSLANAQYVKAYYPVAAAYHKRGNDTQAELWAKKAVAANSAQAQAKALISQISSAKSEEPKADTKTESDDALFAKARTISDYQALANKGYAKAYAPLASLYFSSRNYAAADRWARKALSANAGRQQASAVVNKLSAIGYYDNGENGGKPKSNNDKHDTNLF